MKQIILTIVWLMSLCSMASAQFYNLFYDGGGADDYIANTAWKTGITGVSGINFLVFNKSFGFLCMDGMWGFHDKDHHSQTTQLWTTLKEMQSPTMGVQGRLYGDYISAGMVSSGPRNSIDLDAYGGRSNIRSKGDAYGLSLTSVTAQKIHFNDTVHFNQNAWMTLGPGLNNQTTFSNENQKWIRIGSGDGIAFWGSSGALRNSNPHMLIKQSVFSSILPFVIQPNNNVKMILGSSGIEMDDAWIGTTSNSSLHLGANNNALLELGADHKLYIGLSDAEAARVRTELKNRFHVFVSKGILAEDLAVDPKSTWSDFVFDKGYKLRDIAEVEQFVARNKHLPDVPSAKEIATKEYSLHDMNKVLLQKVEELTLYVIGLQKQIRTLEEEVGE